jgi:hypothetical protein
MEITIKSIIQKRRKKLLGPDKIFQHCQKLKTHPTVKVVNSDKNTGLTVLHIKDYHSSVMRHLNDEKTYKIVTNINTNEWQLTLELIRDDYFTLLNEIVTTSMLTTQAYNFLHNTNCILPNFHVLPKLHKKGNTTRPIVGAPNWITTTWSKWLETELEKFPCNFTIKNSQELISKIEHKSIPPESWLCSADISSLYTKMDLNLLYGAITKKTKNPYYTKILQFICSNNYFKYGENVFRQLNGIAMGTNVADRCANIYLDDFDNQFSKRCLFYSRYIDDIFFVFTGNIVEYIKFKFAMNNYIQDITLTIERNITSVNFLDLTVNRNNSNKIEFRTYRKPINIYQYIPSSSNHSRATIKGFIFGEMIRHVRNNTNKNDRIANIQFFLFKLLKRGYRWNFLQRIFSKIDLDNRSQPTTKELPNSITIPMVIPYYPNQITKNIQKAIFELNARQECKYLGIKLLTAYTKTPNILALCSSSSLTPQHLKTISVTRKINAATEPTPSTDLRWIFSDSE